jgi:hypothetical protein
MKNTTLFLLGAFVTGLFAFKVAGYEARNNTAEVDQIQGC